jgi:hypothetical protein
MFSFQGKGFSCSLDVRNGGLNLRICKFQFWIKKISAVNSFQCLVIKTLDLDMQ